MPAACLRRIALGSRKAIWPSIGNRPQRCSVSLAGSRGYPCVLELPPPYWSSLSVFIRLLLENRFRAERRRFFFGLLFRLFFGFGLHPAPSSLMSTALSALRRQLEELVPTPPIESRGVGTGITALDELLPMRGLPRGKLTEVRGERSSGIATVLRHIVTSVSQDRLVAYVDARRTLMAGDWVGNWESEIKESGKRERGKGKRLHGEAPISHFPFPISRHLWFIRPPIPSDGPWCADVLLRSGAFALVVLDGAPLFSRSTAARLIRLARETGTALVVAGEVGRGSGVVGAAVRVVVGRRESGRHGAGNGKRETGNGRWNHERTSRPPSGITKPGGAVSFPVSRFPFPASRRLVITIEKGGIRRGVEVKYEIGLEDRLCARPAVGDRRGAGKRPGIGNRESGIGQPGNGKRETGNEGSTPQPRVAHRASRVPAVGFPITDSRFPTPLGSAPDRPRLRRRPRAAGVAGGDAGGDPLGDDGDGGSCVMRGARGAAVG